MLPAMRRLAAFLVRWALSALVLMGAVAFVSGENPANTFGRAAVISVVLSVAYYVTLARFLWFLFLPWLLYVGFWLLTIMGAYDVGFFQALVVAVACSVISWGVEKLFGVRTFRKE
jgi:putative membrane protein